MERGEPAEGQQAQQAGERSSRGTFSSMNDIPPRPPNPPNGIGEQLERMMDLMSSMDSRLTAMERSGLNGPSQGSQLEQTFGTQYRGGGAEPSFYRIGAKPGESCPKGLHVCAEPGCFKPHSLQEHR